MTRITEDEQFILNFLHEHADESFDTLSMNKLYPKSEYYTLISEHFSELADNERTAEVVVMSAYELLGDLVDSHTEQQLYAILQRLSEMNIIEMKYTCTPHQRSVLKNLYVKIV